MKKAKKVLRYSLSGLAIVYGLFLMFPQVLFSNSINYKIFTIYYHSDNMDIPKLESILDESIALLSKSEVFDERKKQKIFLCSGFNEFAFFAPRSRKSFAINYPLIQYIFLSQSDIDKNEICRNANENNRRTLGGVIAHETMHSLLEDKLGIFKYKLLPSWKNEGYCDYIAEESSYDEKLGWNQICANNKKEISPSFNYFKYKTYVKYLLDEKEIDFDDFVEEDFDLKTIAFQSRKTFCPIP